ncbi:MAG: TIGR02099 family protein [Zoogloeaceae bacterium]|jgi:uncharacterized protein (TIGR02099 family)|nr:TIGR02099 family protein [Zoogloeaceae bacterium]
MPIPVPAPSPKKTHRIWRALGWGVFALYLAFVAFVLLLRYIVLPGIHQYKAEIEAAAGEALGLPVRIGTLSGHWRGLNPALALEDLRILDQKGVPALRLGKVEGVLSWHSLHSLWRGKPRFALLVLERPVLQVRRDPAGKLFVAGIPLAPSGQAEGGNAGLDWLFAQARIRILDATLAWEDELRGAPPLVLEDVQFELQNRGKRHRFGLSALPPTRHAARLDVRGDWSGTVGAGDNPFAHWQGKGYLQLEQTDLAVWRSWIDYPVAVPQGEGGLRLWLARDNGGWSATADLTLENVRLRLAENLPELELTRLAGRARFLRTADRIQLATEGLALKTRTGDEVAPTDLVAEWRGSPEALEQEGRGSLTINQLDLKALAGLAAYLPLNAETQAHLARHQPEGRLHAFKASGERSGGAWKKYALAARFERLTWAAHGHIPGASGLSGEIAAAERGGTLTLASTNAALSLPAVFAEPETPFTRLEGKIRWTPPGGKDAGQEALDALDIRIETLRFWSPHADGTLSGSYQPTTTGSRPGPGRIDLSGSLSRAEATSVWRYMPKVLHPNVPAWLRQGLLAGTGTAKLTLKGDLADFPFRDPRTGAFRITVAAHDVTLHYGPGWPVIEGIEAELGFGVGMRIEASKGRILGAEVGKTTVEIPDLAVKEHTLLVRGQVSGPSAEFLAFIAQSPVAASINHFTEGMRAEGEGRLELDLDIPLAHLEQTRVAGRYHLEGNRLFFISGLPPASGVAGRIDFSERALAIRGLRGQFLGAPMHLDAQSEAGAVTIRANGGLTAEALRAHFNLPLLARINGSTDWQAEIRVRKSADFVITSDLAGVSATLPAPFGKSATERLPLLLEKSTLENRDEILREAVGARLGNRLEARLERRRQGKDFVVERGMIGIGQKITEPPAAGVDVLITQERLDLDLWRNFLQETPLFPEAAASATTTATTPADPPPGLPLRRIRIDANTLTLLGREFKDARLGLFPGKGQEEGRRWRVDVAADDAVGELVWEVPEETPDNRDDPGRITARFQRLHLTPQAMPPAEQAPPAGQLPSAGPAGQSGHLPGMDIRVEDFSVGRRAFGQLELMADNAGRRWNLRRVRIENPDGQFTGSGIWEADGEDRTSLEFTLATERSGNLLTRMGYPDVLQGGTARLEGKLDWRGAPTALDTATLGGSLRLEAAKGQFSKVEPGVGKLLGLLSLQSLTRRLAFDFHDIFGDGMAYDSITARLSLADGVIRTEGDLVIKGPVGEILMQGSADMKSETQDLRVTVRPEMGSVTAVGVAIAVNPVVGAATYIAQNLLQNPLNKVFRLRYRVTGKWENPEIEKLGITNAFPGSIPPSNIP